MTAADYPPSREVLDSVTEAMVSLHERYHHRTPITGKTQFLGDDLLVCVLGGVYTDVEKTMIELQRSTLVQETRSAFQTAMERRFIDRVEDLVGRRVLAFISNQHVGPDLEIEIFLLAPAD
ncbi:MAG: Na-translocating system protein MpsC family protein [Solirubrobacteraceae bacterium]